MSRCFPFPPPGYEKKTTLDDTDLLTKVHMECTSLIDCLSFLRLCCMLWMYSFIQNALLQLFYLIFLGKLCLTTEVNYGMFNKDEKIH